MRKLLTTLIALMATATLATSTVLATHTVEVYPADMDSWAFRTTGTATAEMVDGPGTPPLGDGSAQLAVVADGDDMAEIRSTTLDGVALADVTALGYSTYVDEPGTSTQAPYIILQIDNDNDGSQDDLLFFEPTYQTGTYPGDTVPNQGTVTTETWQGWDAFVGGWWSLNAGTFGPPLVTIDTYLAANPDATIVASGAGGGLRLLVGSGGAAWTGFIGNADAVVVGVAGDTHTYDFELTPTVVPTPIPTPIPTPTPTLTPTPIPDPSVEPTPVPTAAPIGGQGPSTAAPTAPPALPDTTMTPAAPLLPLMMAVLLLGGALLAVRRLD